RSAWVPENGKHFLAALDDPTVIGHAGSGASAPGSVGRVVPSSHDASPGFACLGGISAGSRLTITSWNRLIRHSRDLLRQNHRSEHQGPNGTTRHRLIPQGSTAAATLAKRVP